MDQGRSGPGFMMQMREPLKRRPDSTGEQIPTTGTGFIQAQPLPFRHKEAEDD